MALDKKHRKLATDHKAVKYRFILTELDLAHTFGEMALASDDPVKAKRNTENAQRAYNAARHFLEDAGFSGKMKTAIHEKVLRLQKLLNRLSSRVKPYAYLNAP